MDVDSKTRLEGALFGICGQEVWVSPGAFVTRYGDDLLVEAFMGRRVISILVHRASTGIMQDIWARLSELAVDEVCVPVTPV